VLISHNMPEVLSVADRVEVLRLGRRVATFTAADTTVEELVGAMTGALDDGTHGGDAHDQHTAPDGGTRHDAPAQADAHGRDPKGGVS
jgi:ABC-type sugar transport system ATPase subunit